MITEILFLMVLIIINAFFASSEIALISMNDNKIRLMAMKGHKKAILLEKLLAEPSNFLATIQIGITFAGFLASAFASESFADRLVHLFKETGLPISESAFKTVSMIIITLLLSYFTLVLGELVPKRLAMKRAESISMFVVKPLTLLSAMTSPFVKLLTGSTNFVVRLLGVNPHEKDEKVTEEEIRMMVDVGEEKGTIHEIEKKMINNIFEFDNKKATDIMTHRTDIVALSLDSDLQEVVTLVNETKHTRIPVYKDNIDNIVGILHAKDLIQFALVNFSTEEFVLNRIIRHPYYVPSSKKTDELFQELQKNKTHMAVIIDEYGGTEGLITMEDLVEEIVGNIFDEYDDEEKDFEQVDEATYVFNGTISLDVVENYLDTELPVHVYETLSGFVIGQIGRIPGIEEKPEIRYNGLVFTVEGVDEKRITTIKVCKE
ncbi:MAG: hemolysin family protein [Eubacteriales bacterium]